MDTCTGDGATWYEGDGAVRWAQDGGDFDATSTSSLTIPSGSQAGWSQWSLTSLAQGWLSYTYPNSGVLLKLDNESRVAGKAVDFYASDFAVAPTLRPKLSVNYADGSHAVGPTIAVSKPVAGELVHGTISVNAGGYDDGRIDRVEFQRCSNTNSNCASGSWVSIVTDTIEPFTAAWDSSSVPNGGRSLRAIATDDAGNPTNSAVVNVTVGNATPPTTSIFSPGANTTVGGTVNVEANASPGVTKVEFYVDGSRFATDTTTPWSAPWNTLDPALPAYDDTSHVLTTKAYDAFGQVTTSVTVPVNVDNSSGTIYQADFSSSAFPTRMEYNPSGPQEQYAFDITVTNRSDEIWDPSDIILKYRWFAIEATTSIVDVAADGFTEPVFPDGQATIHVLVTPPSLPAGVARADFRLRFDLYSQHAGAWFAAQGNAPLEQIAPVGTTAAEAKLGIESYFSYNKEELGLGMRNLVNVATGNSVIRWAPFHAPGIGLSTDLELTYNSGDGDCNPVHCPLGPGWSLGVSSLSRFGHQQFTVSPPGQPNEVTFRQSDGTSYTFTKVTPPPPPPPAPPPPAYWKAPDGVHLYLRQVGDQWALTRPDRTTYYYTMNGQHGYPAKVVDKNGNQLTFDASNQGEVSRVTDQAGQLNPPAPNRHFDLVYNDEHTLASVSDHLGHTLTFTYDVNDHHRLTDIVETGGTTAEGKPLTPRGFHFTYDPNGQPTDRKLISVLDPRLHTTTFEYFADGKLKKRWNRMNTEPTATNFSYNQLAHETTVTSPLGRATVFHYFTSGVDDGSVDTIRNPANETTETVWTQAGQPRRHVWKTIEPHAQGQPARSSEFAYNDNGFVTDQWDQLRSHTTYEYRNLPADLSDTRNSISLLIKRTNPRGTLTPPPLVDDYSWDYVYDVSNINLLTVKDPPDEDGNRPTTNYTYNSNGTVASVQDQNQHFTYFEVYDNNGLSTRVKDANNHITQYFYDDDGVLQWSEDPLHYGSSGGDPSQYRTVYYYDSFHRLEAQSAPKSTLSAVAPNLIWSTTAYDANDNVVSTRQADYVRGHGDETTTEYDFMDRKTCIHEPDPGGFTRFEYDAAGRLSRTTLPKGVATPAPAPSTCPTGPRGDDYVTENVYDQLDRVIAERGYNENGVANRLRYSCYEQYTGDLLWATAPKANWPGPNPPDCNGPGDPPSHTTRYTYDWAHRPLTETEPVAPQATRMHSQEYDENGNVKRAIDEEGTRTDFTYTQRDERKTTAETFTKDASNIPTRVLMTKFVYDGVGNIIREVSPRAWDACGSCDPGPGGAYVTEYRYDSADQLNRTALPRAGAAARTYIHRGYDENGNLSLLTLPVVQDELPGIPDNAKTNLSYWDTGWIRASNDHVNAVVTYDYEAEGWQSLRDRAHGSGHQMRWFYYPNGLLHYTTDRHGGGSKFTYDLNDNETSAEKLRDGGEPARYTIESFYDGYDEPTKVRQLTSPTSWRFTGYSYDRNGNLAAREDDGLENQAGGVIQAGRLHDFAYDESDQLTQHRDLGVDHLEGAGDELVTLNYWPTGRENWRTLKRYVAGSGYQARLWTGRTYFANGDLKTVSTRQGTETAPLLEQHTLEYREAAPLPAPADGIYVNGNRTLDSFTLASPNSNARCQTVSCTTKYVYGPRENLITEEATRPAPGQATTVRKTEWDLNPTMNVTDEWETLDQGARELRRHYEYEGNRLTRSTDYTQSPPAIRKYFYQDGNLRCVTTDAGTGCPSDAFGAAPGPTLIDDYKWDQRDRLKHFQHYGLEPSSASYGYDPLDRPVSEIDTHSGATWTRSFTYLGLSGDISSENQNPPPGIPSTVKTYSYGPDGERVGMAEAGVEYYFARNVHTDVSLLLTAGDTQPNASFVYRAYGARDGLSQGDPEGPGMTNAYRFNDKRLDVGSGSTDMGARRYSTDLGRFLSQDELLGAAAELGLTADGLTQNRFAFASANPVTFVEFDGHSVVPGEGGSLPWHIGSRMGRSPFAVQWDSGWRTIGYLYGYGYWNVFLEVRAQASIGEGPIKFNAEGWSTSKYSFSVGDHLTISDKFIQVATVAGTELGRQKTWGPGSSYNHAEFTMKLPSGGLEINGKVGVRGPGASNLYLHYKAMGLPAIEIGSEVVGLHAEGRQVSYGMRMRSIPRAPGKPRVLNPRWIAYPLLATSSYYALKAAGSRLAVIARSFAGSSGIYPPVFQSQPAIGRFGPNPRGR